MNQDIWMNGRWHAGRGAAFESICPATGEAVWQGAAADAQQVTLAVEAAKAAFLGWSQQTFAQRRDILLQYAENISEQKDRIALAISRDMGKPLWEAQVEAGAMSAKVAISIQSYQERTGEQITGSLSLRHKPHGVMAVFGPFNFPGHLPNGHIVPSLLAGNCVVFKPSELTPSVAQIMVECFANAGLPDGVFNIIQGGRDTGAALLNAEIDGLLFTGSAETGIAFHRHFAGRPEVMLALEMGGNNPLIVTEDAKIEAAADIAFMSGFITSGQRCSCARRLIVPEGKYGDEVIEAIIARIQAVKIGAWHEDVFMGPVVSVKAAQAALNFEAMLVKLGGKALHGLERLRPDSAFLRPGLIDTTDADVPDQELFGPLMQIIRVPDFKAAISRANATRFGLAAGVISDNPKVWETAQQTLKAGILNWNTPTTGAASALPFGGPGLSGNHRPSAYYAADYCAWPQASQTAVQAQPPKLMHF